MHFPSVSLPYSAWKLRSRLDRWSPSACPGTAAQPHPKSSPCPKSSGSPLTWEGSIPANVHREGDFLHVLHPWGDHSWPSAHSARTACLAAGTEIALESFPAWLKQETPAWQRHSALPFMALHCGFAVFLLTPSQGSRLRLLLPLPKAPVSR